MLGKIRKWLRKGKLSFKGWFAFFIAMLLGGWVGNWAASFFVGKLDATMATIVTMGISAGVIYYIWEKWFRKYE